MHRDQIPPGTLYMLILRTLARGGEMHGYEIASFIKKVSDEVLHVEEGSLYPALQRMLLKGWVTAAWGTTEGIIALILASIGLYGVAAYTVARRTSEIGIRMALGAQRGSVIGMVLSGAMQPIGLGLLVGVPVALAGGHAIASQLFGVKGYDPLLLCGAVAVLAAAAVLAALVPARRAASIDPIRALRTE